MWRLELKFGINSSFSFFKPIGNRGIFIYFLSIHAHIMRIQLSSFSDWDVVYCSVPTSPGGGYRSALGRLVLKTKEMIQGIEAPDIVKNKVTFSAFGFLDGEVSLKGLSQLTFTMSPYGLYSLKVYNMLAEGFK